MSDAAIAGCLVMIAALTLVVAVALGRRLDARRPAGTNPVSGGERPPPGAQAAIVKAIAPGVGMAFVWGLIAFRRVWAGAALAAMTAAFGYLGPRRLWYHARSRR